jgi:hypothetical protein
MRRSMSLATIGLGLMFCSGCAMVASPLPGSIYTSVKYPSMAGSTAGPGTKRGEASASSILGIVATGDASIEAATRNGGITKIHTVDAQVKSVMGFYASYTTVVTGE